MILHDSEWAEPGPLRQRWSCEGLADWGWRDDLFTHALGPWCSVVGGPFAPCSDLPHTRSRGSRGVPRGRKAARPLEAPALEHIQCHFCMAQSKAQGQLDSWGQGNRPRRLMERAAQYCRLAFQAATPVLYTLQSIPVAKQELFNAVDLTNQGLQTDCQGLSVITGMFKHLGLQRFYIKLNLNFFFSSTKWKPWYTRLAATSPQGAGAK